MEGAGTMHSQGSGEQQRQQQLRDAGPQMTAAARQGQHDSNNEEPEHELDQESESLQNKITLRESSTTESTTVIFNGCLPGSRTGGKRPAKPCSEKGYYLLAAKKDFQNTDCIHLLDAMTNELLWSAEGKDIFDFSYSPARNLIIESSRERGGGVNVWDLVTCQCERLPFKHIEWTFPGWGSYCISNAGDRLVVFNIKAFELWDLCELKFLFVIKGFSVLLAACFNGDDSRVVCGEEKTRVILVYDAVNGDKISSFDSFFDVRSFVCSPIGSHNHDTVCVWDIHAGHTKLHVSHEISCFCFGRNDEHIVAVNAFNCQMTTWELVSGDVIFKGIIPSVRNFLPMLQFSVASSNVVIRGCFDGFEHTLEIDPLSGKEILRGEQAPYEPVNFVGLIVGSSLSVLL
jgi:hypothetical protein